MPRVSFVFVYCLAFSGVDNVNGCEDVNHSLG